MTESATIKRFAAHLALVLAGTAFALLMCEGIVRILGVGGTTIASGRIQQNDPDAGWTGYPNIDVSFQRVSSFDVRVLQNSRGLRDSEKDYAKPPGTYRIVVLGDSIMWGHGVENEEMLSTVLQEQLPNSETVNLGVKGYSTVQELVRLEVEGLQYEPDLILLTFCLNDLEDNFDDKHGARPVAMVDEQGILHIVNRPVNKPFKAPIKQWFNHHSRLFGFVHYRADLIKLKLKKWRHSSAKKAESQASPEKPPAPNDKRDLMSFSTVDLYSPPGPEMDLAWKAIHLLLAEIKGLADKNGARLLIVYAASAEVADKSLFAEIIRSAGFDPESTAIDWDRPANRLSEICGDLNTSYVDLNPAFRSHPQPMSLFLNGDPHWSAMGHSLAAETVAAKINALKRE